MYNFADCGQAAFLGLPGLTFEQFEAMRYRRNWIVPKGKELTDMDRKILFYQEHGHLVPSPKLIKTPEQIEGIRRSGKINTGVLDLVEKEIHA